jgi:RNA polymerase sigma factor (sigma-70 family)
MEPEAHRDFPKPIKYGKAEIERAFALETLGMTDAQVAAELGIAIAVVKRLKTARATNTIRLGGRLSQECIAPAPAPTTHTVGGEATGKDPRRNVTAKATPPSQRAGVKGSALAPTSPPVPPRKPPLRDKTAFKQLGHNARTYQAQAGSTPHEPHKCARTRNTQAPKKSESVESVDNSGDSPKIYFKQIQALNLLTPADEVALAKRLEETETAAWRLMLEAPAVIDRVRDIFAERAVTAEESTELPDFTRGAEALAPVLRNLDHERLYSTAILRTVTLSVTIMEQLRALQCEAENVRERFIKSNLRLVISMAKKWSISGVPLADLIQEGNLGLMHAVPRYDHRKGFRFSTFAVWWIRHALSRFIQNKSRVVRVPVHLQEAGRKINQQRGPLTARLGREPTLEELSEATQLPKHKLEAFVNMGAALKAHTSLEAANADGPNLLEQIVDPRPSVAEDLIAEESRRRVAAALATLPEREASVLRKRFGIGRAPDQEGVAMTLGEIGDECGLSRERIRQLEKRALTKLHLKLTLGKISNEKTPRASKKTT